MNIDFTEDEIVTIGVVFATLPAGDPEVERMLSMISFKCLAAVDPDGAMDVIVKAAEMIGADT